MVRYYKVRFLSQQPFLKATSASNVCSAGQEKCDDFHHLATTTCSGPGFFLKVQIKLTMKNIIYWGKVT